MSCVSWPHCRCVTGCIEWHAQVDEWARIPTTVEAIREYMFVVYHFLLCIAHNSPSARWREKALLTLSDPIWDIIKSNWRRIK